MSDGSRSARPHADEQHIEAVCYPGGSDGVGRSLQTRQARHRPDPSWLALILRHPCRRANPKGWARSTLILLVMQTLDTHIKLRLTRSIIPPFRKKLQTQTDGNDIPTYIPQANRFAERMAEQIDGVAATALTEILFNVPTTAHILGGAAMGAGPREGVIDARNRVFNYKNLYVCDGSMIGANLGVNPSLSITALTEHAMSHVRTARETDWSDTGQATRPVSPASGRAPGTS
jgi:cholesterol oxidase